jgi:hypothetical protein
MIRFLTFYSILVATVVLSSCNGQVKEKRIQQIDSLGSILNHVNEVVTSVDPDLITGRVSEINETGNWFLDNLEDTLDPEPGIVLGDFFRCKKFYNKAAVRYNQVKTELEYSEAQLSSLRADVNNGLYTDEEFDQHLKSEATSTAKLLEAADELDGSYTSVNTQFAKCKKAVVALKDSIKSIILSPDPV